MITNISMRVGTAFRRDLVSAGAWVKLRRVAYSVVLAWGWRRHPADLREPRSMAELAVGLGAMIIVDPLAWKAHYVTLIAAYFLVFRELRHRPRSDPRWVWWWVSFACLTLSAPVFVGNRLNDVLESWNVILVGAGIVVGLAFMQTRNAEVGTRN